MTGFSGIEGKTIQRPGGQRYLVHWKARFFMADKVIHPTVVNAVFKGGISFHFHTALPLGSEIHLEFAVKYRGELVHIRIKAKIDYCLLKSNGEGSEIDALMSKISREDAHTFNNILQALSESKEFNLSKP